eukprot:8330589-Alexandrium_andersonii.AAC.1
MSRLQCWTHAARTTLPPFCSRDTCLAKTAWSHASAEGTESAGAAAAGPAAGGAAGAAAGPAPPP